jgi:hypothetical protein
MRKLIKFFLVICALSILTWFIFWATGHPPIAYHNRCVKNAIGNSTSIEISIVPELTGDGTPPITKPSIFVTDRKEIDQMLSHFILPWHQRNSKSMHECDGHLVIKVMMPDSTVFNIRYDHGNGIYPIDDGDDFVGFIHLSKSACSELNKYFLSKGITNRNIGIYVASEDI